MLSSNGKQYLLNLLYLVMGKRKNHQRSHLVTKGETEEDWPEGEDVMAPVGGRSPTPRANAYDKNTLPAMDQNSKGHAAK